MKTFGFCTKCSKPNKTETEGNIITASFSTLCIECQENELSLDMFRIKDVTVYEKIGKKKHPSNSRSKSCPVHAQGLKYFTCTCKG